MNGGVEMWVVLMWREIGRVFGEGRNKVGLTKVKSETWWGFLASF